MRHLRWLLVLPAVTLVAACGRTPGVTAQHRPDAAPAAVSHGPAHADDEAAEHGDFEAITASGCGVERWSIKTGTDAGARKINITTPRSTTIAAMRALKPPNPIPAGSRAAPAETTDWTMRVILVEYKLESDSDYHLVVKDGLGRTMIAEIPSPSCVALTSPFRAKITAARAAFSKRYHVTSTWQRANVIVTITGVGFFDYLHGQTGVAPNGIEIHPVLGVALPAAALPVPATAPSVGPASP